MRVTLGVLSVVILKDISDPRYVVPVLSLELNFQ